MTPSTSVREDESFVAVSEFARICGVSEKTVHRWIKRKLISFEQPGGPRTRILIPKNALRRADGGDQDALGMIEVEVIEASAQKRKRTERLPGPKPRWTRNSSSPMRRSNAKAAKATGGGMPVLQLARRPTS